MEYVPKNAESAAESLIDTSLLASLCPGPDTAYFRDASGVPLEIHPHGGFWKICQGGDVITVSNTGSITRKDRIWSASPTQEPTLLPTPEDYERVQSMLEGATPNI